MLDRRTFFKNTLISATGVIVLPLFSFAEQPFSNYDKAEALEQGFLNPPTTSRPQAYWMWMNGHITKKGILLDLEIMKKIGLSGAFIYNTGTGIPKGPVEYGSEEWQELLLYALEEAHRLGLELSMHNAPGYSSTGASWVSPEMSMQQLVWSETYVRSNGSIDIQLAQPYTRLNYYKDAFVIAYPSLEGEKVSLKERVAHIYVNGATIDKDVLLDNNLDTKIRLEPKSADPAVLVLEFAEPFEARAISVTRTPEPSKALYDDVYDQAPTLLLESSDDNSTYQTVCTINMPLLRYIAAPGTQSFVAVKAKYFRLSTSTPTWISGVELFTAPRLTDWPSKANFSDQPINPDQQIITPACVIDPASVVDISDKLTKNNHLSWNAPVGDWTILRFGHTCTGTKTVSAPDTAAGLEIDKLSKEAVDFYFQTTLAHLFSSLQSFIPDTFKAVIIDSYEIGKQNWTSQFPSAFRQRRGYDLAVWLPALTGRIVKDVENTEKILSDIRRTHADLVAENYYGRFRQHCHDFGLKLYAQPYGDGVFDSLQVGQHADKALAEFWTHYVPGTISICDQAVSISHGYGKNMVSVEAFTGMPLTSRWTEYPYSLKSQGDHIYSRGVNHFVFHVFVHQPYTTGLPGMTMGPYGTHFDRNLTWINQAAPWIQYLTRTQYLLQQGIPVADVCYFKGEEPTSGIPDVNHVDPPVPRNLAGDVIGPDVLMNRIKIENGCIVLPDGMTYRLMIMAPLQKVSYEVLKKLRNLVADGMTLIVTSKPVDVPGSAGDISARAAVHQLADELWGNLDGADVKERPLGTGKMYWNTPLERILKLMDVRPDFEFTAKNRDAVFHYTHRRAGDADIYFISNHLRRSEAIVCSFRITGKTPEIWNAEAGTIAKAAQYELVDGRINLPITFDPAGSVFVLFRHQIDQQPLLSVSRNAVALSTTKPFPVIQKPFQNVTNNFTIALWIKPDTYAYPGKGILIFPAEGETEYGPGHACCGLAAGQNRVNVFEREKGPNRDAQQLITSTKLLEGWTHIALRYEQGAPSLFINGELTGTHKGSGKIVHPGLQTPPTDELFSAIFEGNYTTPELHSEALSNAAIYQLFKKGIPPPVSPPDISINQANEGALLATIGENGRYVLKSKHKTLAFDVQDCKNIAIDSPWRVEFPQGSGTLPVLHLDTLYSLHQHPDFDVRHFSGTVSYFNTFQFSESERLYRQKVFLDLGRVEVLAEVKLNDTYLGVLWKEPYRVDITNAVITGKNNLEIRVTNLWPNRMIGDAHLPQENNFDENGLIIKLPEWYLNNQPKPGTRKTFSAWNTFKKTDPLLASGLLGPVRLIMGIEKWITKM